MGLHTLLLTDDQLAALYELLGIEAPKTGEPEMMMGIAIKRKLAEQKRGRGRPSTVPKTDEPVLANQKRRRGPTRIDWARALYIRAQAPSHRRERAVIRAAMSEGHPLFSGDSEQNLASSVSRGKQISRAFERQERKLRAQFEAICEAGLWRTRSS